MNEYLLDDGPAEHMFLEAVVTFFNKLFTVIAYGAYGHRDLVFFFADIGTPVFTEPWHGYMVYYDGSSVLGGTMRLFVTMMLCCSLVVSASAAEGYKLKYDGGSLGDLKTGADVRLLFSSDAIRFESNYGELLKLKPSNVTEISYGQDVHRRVGAAIGLAVVSFGVGALMALTKSKKHFIGLTWDDNGKKGGVAFQADKNDYRGVLAGLEGVTGKKAINSDAMTVKN